MYCGMLEKDEMPEDPSVNTRDFLIYNPGTETCETLIRIGGSAGEDGVTITNNTNGSECKLLSLPSSGYLEIDSFHGTVVHVEGDNRTLDFEYHDEGYLTLASYGKRTDEVMATTQSGSATVTQANCKIDDSLIGKYIRLGNAWLKIEATDEDTVTVSSALAKSETVITKITGMNEISISGSNLNLTKLEIDYYPMMK